ncbi:MAG: phosphoenolpyruvate--protein phosphotransferase [Hyphomicrobiaceae bacterium]|nr:phosphoenolpyruvate--protein phosphotransferase [Hyphomicrobiaceae bacterium]
MERKLTGRPASPGLYVGPAAVLSTVGGPARTKGHPFDEQAALRAAVAASLKELSALAAGANGEARRIMGIQEALLEDEALIEAALAAITRGEAADMAWRDSMAHEIAGYEAAEDEYFRARAADLVDVRDRVLRHLTGGSPAYRAAPGTVLIAPDLPPSTFLSHDWSQGGAVVLAQGSTSSHVAMLARARGVPMVVGVDTDGRAEDILVVDGDSGLIITDPKPETLASVERRKAAAAHARTEAQARVAEPALTKDGTRIAVMINVATPDDLIGISPKSCDGIGLVRTEFLMADGALRDEQRQFELYSRLVSWADARPVTIRTLDAGGDKPIPGYTVEGEKNPFLGLRGIRLSLRHRGVFRIQLRALARAAALGPVKIMLPMVTKSQELAEATELLDEVVFELEREGASASRPQLGIMIEVPLAALAIDQFDAAFFSIGSNDLVQYVTASSRDGKEGGQFGDVTHLGVLRLIAAVAAHGARTGREVSLCGDAGADPHAIPALLAAGVHTLSVAPGLLAATKDAVRSVDLRRMAQPHLLPSWWDRLRSGFSSSAAKALFSGTTK